MSSELILSSCEPGEQLSFLVKRYLFLESKKPTGCFSDKHLPEGSCNLIFNFKGEVRMNLDQKSSQILPPYFLTIPYPGYVNIQAMPPIDTFVIACKTSVFSSFFNISLHNCPEPSFRSIHDVIPQTLWNNLRDTGSQKMRIKVFEDFIGSVAKGRMYEPDRIDSAYEQICSSNGLVNVNDLATALNLNNRSFRRNFCRRVGISAKSLCRIVRAADILRTVTENKAIDFQNIVYSKQYFDQAHLVHDFRKFTGESPASFFHRDIQMVRLFSGL